MTLEIPDIRNLIRPAPDLLALGFTTQEIFGAPRY